MMRRLALLILFAFVLTSSASAQTDWRFGFEDTWSHLSVLLNAEQREILLTKLQVVVESQQTGGDVNFPALNSGWSGKQPNEGGAINFANSDEMVRLLQAHGFSMLWNLRINARWSSADNPDCYGLGDCAPDSAHEDDLYDFIHAVVERYDGDGLLDMGHETPNDTSDDLRIPIRFYLMTGEIEFAGAYPPSQPGYGDAAENHFWTDSIDNLLRTHRIIYRAMHDADPTGNTSLVSSGGVLWDLYSDFPDYPEIEGPTLQARLNGNNNHNAVYVASFGRLKQMLTSFGDDSDGLECDYIGWHPHTPWREVEQTFSLIKIYAGDKPIYVDDMWCNMALADRADSPGATLFTGGGQAMEGDFPNSLVPDYTALRNGVIFNNREVVRWYYAKHARTIVKAFASVFGEGAERASISGTTDLGLVRLSPVGFINIMGTPAEGLFEKPGYYTYKLLVDKLHDFTLATELAVSSDPRTRVYEFERAARGAVYVMWSETGDAPPNLDYAIATGETVSLDVFGGADSLQLTHIISDTADVEPEVEKLPTVNGQLILQLGYEPVFVEGAALTVTEVEARMAAPAAFTLEQNYPNPFNPSTTIQYELPEMSHVTLRLYNLVGQEVQTLVDATEQPGIHAIEWNGKNSQGAKVGAGVYIVRMVAGEFSASKRVLLLK